MSINHKIYIFNMNFLKRNYFSTKNFQTTVYMYNCPEIATRSDTKSCLRQHSELSVVSFLRMCIMNNGQNQGCVISMRAVDQKQDYQLEWPYHALTFLPCTIIHTILLLYGTPMVRPIRRGVRGVRTNPPAQLGVPS